VLGARLLENGIRFGLGSTLAFRRSDLQSIGGFESLLDYLADDYQLGKKVAEKGLEVEVVDTIVETYLPASTFREFLRHQLRWARTIRDSRRWGYLGLASTFGLVWAFLTLVLAPGGWAWILLGVTLAFRCAVALAVGKFVLQDESVLPQLWLIPLRDVLAFGIWIASFMGSTVSWRGESYTLEDGRLSSISPKNKPESHIAAAK
jgi:ceramide glucosyltransferase